MNKLYCYQDYITLNPDLHNLNEQEAMNHWTTTGYQSMRLCNKAQLVVASEFGPEILLYACYYYYLFKNGLFFDNKITTYKGMKDFYYFIDPQYIIEKEVMRNWTPPNQRPFLVNNTEHVHRFNMNYWYPIPYKRQFQNTRFIYEKPLLIIQNKYNDEWKVGPVNFFSVETLDTMFSTLKDKYTIVYIRPTTHRKILQDRAFSLDHNTMIEDLQDYELIERKYKNDILLFDNLLAQTSLTYNRMKLELFASCTNYISVQGGNAHMITFFYEKLLVLHKRGFELEAGAYTGWYLDACPMEAKTVKVVRTDEELLVLLSIFCK